MTEINIQISYSGLNAMSLELAQAEITETIDDLANSLRTQVNDVQISLTVKDQ